MTGLFTYKAIFKLLPPATVIFFIKREKEHDHFTRASKGLSNQYAQTVASLGLVPPGAVIAAAPHFWPCQSEKYRNFQSFTLKNWINPKHFRWLF